MKLINCVGLACPGPVIETKKYFDSISKGEAQIVVDNEVAKNNIIKFANGKDLETKFLEENGLYKIIIKKSISEEKINTSEEFSIVIGSNLLGSGEEALGRILMKTYLYALSESDKLPKQILFINSGVKLTVKNSESLNALNTLKEKGVEILSCGTCLDFYKIKDELAIGEVTNMYTIVEIMNSSKNTIKL